MKKVLPVFSPFMEESILAEIPIKVELRFDIKNLCIDNILEDCLVKSSFEWITKN
jgi:hypothetical protein